MAEKGKNGGRDYKKEYREYHGTAEQRKKRSERNKSRRAYEKEHGELPSNVDVDHKRRLAKGGSSTLPNLRASSQKQNRGWRRGKKGYG